MPQLTTTEQNLIDKLVRKEKKKPIEAWRAVKKYRAKTKGKSKKAKGLSPNTVYEYCKGETHQRGALETRGRLPTLTKAEYVDAEASVGYAQRLFFLCGPGCVFV